MESYAGTLGPEDIACLTESRIADALFGEVSGFLITRDEVDTALGIRLRGRSARFAAYGAEAIQQFQDGAVIALWPGRTDETATGFTASGARRDTARSRCTS